MKLLTLAFAAFIINAEAKMQTSFYFGESVKTSIHGGQQNKEILLLKKIIDTNKSELVEIACFKEKNKKSTLHSIFMKIEGRKIVKISESRDFSSGPLTGTGLVKGEKWNWDYLKFSMQYKVPNGLTIIEDENWVKGGVLTAHKDIYWKSGPQAQEMKIQEIKVSAKEIDYETYKSHLKTLGCPQN